MIPYLLPKLEGTIWNRGVGMWAFILYIFSLAAFYELLSANYFLLPGKLMAFEIYLIFVLSIYVAVSLAVEFAEPGLVSNKQSAITIKEGIRSLRQMLARRRTFRGKNLQILYT